MKSDSNKEAGIIKIVVKDIPTFFKKLFRNKIFLIALGLIVLVALSFLAGMKVDSIISNNKTTSTTVSSNPTSNATAESFSGKVTKIDDKQLELSDKDGKVKQFEINERTIFVSKEAKVIKSSDIKVGYTMTVYSTRSNNVSYLVRAKVVTTPN
ncbi:MAG: hypothetical protein WCO33_01100 [bacterium]